jgi:hypothetical protein
VIRVHAFEMQGPPRVRRKEIRVSFCRLIGTRLWSARLALALRDETLLLSLNDDEYAAVQAAAAPIHPLQRAPSCKLSPSSSSGIQSLDPAWCTVWPRISSAASPSRPDTKRPPSLDT